MKHWFLALGSLFLAIGLFYDVMPVELFGAISQVFRPDSDSVYFRIVPTEQVDPFQISFLFIGIAFLIASVLMRSAKSQQ